MTRMFKARYSIFYSLLFVSIACESLVAFGKPFNLQISESDDPREVLKKTLSASRSIKSYRVRVEVPSISKDVTIMEYVFPDRTRMFGKNQELISIGKNTYHKKGDDSWEKYSEKVPVTELPATALENNIKNLAEAKDIKFIGHETVDGIPTLAYQHIIHLGNHPHTTKTWIGVADGLLRRWEFEHIVSSSTKLSFVYTYYDYNADIKIEPPKKYVSVKSSFPETITVDPRLKPKRDELTMMGLPEGVPGPPPSSFGSGVGIGPGGYSMGGGNPDGSAGSVDSRPVLLNRPRPNYTEEATNNKIQGVVHVRVLIGTDGAVKQVKVIRGLPDGLTDEAIVAAYRMRFKPAMKNGQPIAYWLNNVEIEFRP